MVRIEKHIDSKSEDPKQKMAFKPMDNFIDDGTGKKEGLVNIPEDKRSTDDVDKTFLGYLYWLNPHCILFTSINKAQLIETYFFNQFLSKIAFLFLLWFSYKLMDDAIALLYEQEFQFTIDEIDAVYLNTFKVKSPIRPLENRKINFSSDDAEQSYEELKVNYGLRPKRIAVTIQDCGSFTIIKSFSMISFKECKHAMLVDFFIPWLYRRASEYIDKINDFKIQNIVDPITMISNAVSNVLIFDYESTGPYSPEQILTSIRETPQVKILSEYEEEDEWDIKIGEKNSKSIVNLYLNPSRLYFSMDDGDSFNSIFPLLETLDNIGELTLLLSN